MSISTELKLLAQARQDVHVLCDVLYERMTQALDAKKPFPELNRLILTKAVDTVFYGRFRMVSGYCIFATEFTTHTTGQRVSHHWLAMDDTPSHIIDVLPVDGKLGVSCPQAVISHDSPARFFEENRDYRSGLSPEEIKALDKKIEDVVQVLESCMEKIPF